MLSSKQLFLEHVVQLTDELNLEFDRKWVLVEDTEHHHQGTGYVLRWYDENLAKHGHIAFSFGNTGVSLALNPSRYRSQSIEYYYDALDKAYDTVRKYLSAEA
jgi:hypothetical protein